jgi:hypothetical protein
MLIREKEELFYDGSLKMPCEHKIHKIMPYTPPKADTFD